MLTVSQLSVSFSGFELFKEITFLINKTDRIGLVGKNGAGKSTLLKIIAGEQEPDKGNIAKPSDLTMGYLPQEMEHQGGKTVFGEALTAFEQVLKLREESEKLTHEMSHRKDTHSSEYMDLITRLYEVNERFQMLGGYDMESETEKVLLGLGFMRHDFEKPTEEFSGGWRMRIELAKILLQHPDLILLDEPTNHLDIESIQWLENFLKNYSGAIVLVSHDRIFLDTVTNRSIEITMGKIFDYKASYSRYLEFREERRTLNQAAYDNQQKEIAEKERFVERFKAKASKATQAQSRVKQLEKIERIEIEDEDTASIRFRFPEPPRAGAVVVKAIELNKHYGEKHVLKNLDFEIARGEKIAFVGKNGEGKSTLSRIIAMVESYEGELDLGHNVHMGYYAQNQAETLTGDKTVFQTIDDAAIGEMRTKVRSLLGAFLFSGQAADKKVKVLSGGEKSRLAMAKLLLEPVNLLVLDEPTNHLDMRSKDVLKEALMNYTGSMVIVSHDRDFLQGLTNKVFEFRNQGIKEHIGDIYDYLRARKIDTLDALQITKDAAKDAAKETAALKAQMQSTAPAPAKVAPKPVEAKSNKDSYEQKKIQDREKQRIERQISQVEAKIESLEKEKNEIENKLSTETDFAKQKELMAAFDKNKKENKDIMASWEALMLELEKF